MSKLDEFLELLKDGAWHNLTGIAEILKLTPDKLERTAEILTKQDLIRYIPKAKKVKISPEWVALLTEQGNPKKLTELVRRQDINHFEE